MSRVIPRTGLKGQERLIPAESAGYMGLHSYGMKREPEAVKRESDRRNRLSMGKGLIYGKYENLEICAFWAWTADVQKDF